jgi:osmotically-inducible protein OsmY
VQVKVAIVGCAVALVVGCGPSESEIRLAVRQQLDANETTGPLGLSVEVRNRVVYLSGKTSTPEEQELAVKLATVDGVKLVVHDMWINNRELADKVRAALASDAIVANVPIEVDAEGSTIRLMSDATNADERARAMQIASAVEGVTQVEDRMK